MSFRKRNVGLSGPSSRTPPASNAAPSSSKSPTTLPPGVRPSPLDGRPTTSTGTQTLDNLLAGHAGLALGNTLLVEESGTTDFAGTLLRYYAAEGIVQGHKVHVVGVGEQWGRELPGLVGAAGSEGEGKNNSGGNRERMKIAWRYERLGEFGTGALGSRAPPTPDRSPKVSLPGKDEPETSTASCHSFDLTKRLPLPSSGAINFIPVHSVDLEASPFTAIINSLSQQLSSTPPGTIHRLVIPTLLSPAFYPSRASRPKYVLQFLHALRSLCRQYSTQFTAMLTIPLTLFPRSTGLVRWMELLSDGVLELAPFPHSIDVGPSITTSGAATAQEEKPQGMVRVHRLPVFHEKGGGGGGGGGGCVGDDLAFTVSRRKFMIKPFSLPPVEGDTEAQKGEADGKPTKIDIDF
ncbi:MAG: hypothetical protein LQ347_002930 [Umbilicaria vellea]|nr:MAG: hypothetical protein LQ347_002930 [Umbilicaria vellea]